jgi:demethoxyubiquinone hydroxylase (CLK1/Coq7/Cat5 family)
MEKINELYNNLEVSKLRDYLIEQRNDALEHLNDLIKTNSNVEIIQNVLKLVLRICDQIKLLEDSLIVYRIMKKMGNYIE